ncbi:MerR family transcriptional regulator [Pseudonocardia parietis]|uniref:DNA-binding transcriptional MerR regulator n=1 Tax=Pseudonocardia parietis TaxID=570936 RepID=A0ABS4W4P8_9PSEU|nr:MerR family transcriptional regulator [Pseudonocardia parietis]MBP2371190.1 DNA-binding transcriptional MerR regulator [Pseudonocardia parietis]
MRVSELSRSSDVPVATIKYYLREGLLHRGEATSPNQARYDDTHLRRLRLIRALVEVGGLPITVVKDVLAAVDDPDIGMHHVLGRAAYAVTGTGDDGGEFADAAEADVRAITAHTGWRVAETAPALAGARSVLARMHELGHAPGDDTLLSWAEAADRAAEGDLKAIARNENREDAAETAVVGTVLGDALLAALRRIAQESHSAARYPSDCRPPS